MSQTASDLRKHWIEPLKPLDGYLESYRRVEGVWSGFVRYSTKPGDNYLGWFEEPRIRGH